MASFYFHFCERELRVWILPFFLQSKSRDNISLNSLCLLLALIKHFCNTQNRKYATDRNVRVGAEFFLRVSSFLPHGKSGLGLNMKLLRNGYGPVLWKMLANMIVIVHVAVLDITCCAAMLKFRNSEKRWREEHPIKGSNGLKIIDFYFINIVRQ